MLGLSQQSWVEMETGTSCVTSRDFRPFERASAAPTFISLPTVTRCLDWQLTPKSTNRVFSDRLSHHSPGT